MKRPVRGIPVQTFCLAITGLLSLVGAGLAIYLTANGPWGFQDSGSYIITARNMARGLGFGYYLPSGGFVVWTIKPPVFSAVLAAIGIFGADLVAAARWFNIIVYAACIFLTGLIFIRFTSAPLLSIPAGLLMIAFPTMIRMAGSVMSEPLFTLFLTAGIFALLGYFRYGTKGWLAFSALAVGLLPMTRYIGVAMIPVGAAAVFLFLPGSWKKRLGHTVLFGFLASLPILVWQGWVYLFVDRSLAGRVLSLEWSAMPARFVQFYSGVTQLILTWMPLGGAIWNLRFRYRYALIFLVAVGLFVATLGAARKVHKDFGKVRLDSDIQLTGLAVLWLASYLAFLAVDGLVMIPIPPIPNRILLPLFTGLLLGVLGMLAIWQAAWFKGGWRWLKALPWALAVLGAAWYTPVTLDEVLIRYHQGVGMTAYTWRASETMAAVRALPPDTVIVANDSYTLWIWADRTAYSVMENLDAYFITKDQPYGAWTNDPAQAAFRNGAALVIFEDEFAEQMESAYGQAGLTRLDSLFSGLTVGASYPDGKIFYDPQP
jgi:hypothetical protein